jgi:hypothetical protein
MPMYLLIKFQITVDSYLVVFLLDVIINNL